MKKYEAPFYEKEGVETTDLIMASIQNAGTASVGNIEGDKGIFAIGLTEIF